MARKKLLWQIYPYHLIIIVASLLAVSLYASYEVQRAYLKDIARQLEARSRLIASQLKPESLDDPQQLDRLAERLGQQSHTRITVIDSDGVVLADSDEDPAVMENHRLRPEFNSALQGMVGVDARLSNTLQKRMMYVAIPIIRDSRVLGALRTAVPITVISDVLTGLNTRLAIGGVVIFALATIMSLFIIRRITRPVIELREGANRFARGDFSTRLPVPDTEEIAALAESMNHMAGQLDERLRAVVKQRNEQEAVLAAMMEGVIAVDSNEHVINLNAAAALQFQVEPGRARGRAVQEAFRHADLNRFVTRTLAGDQPTEGEILITADEGERILQAHGTILRDDAGQRAGAVIVLNDLTRIKRLENIRRDFVANVSHELKTPITSIAGFVETLLDGAMEQPQESRKFLEIILKHANRLNALVEDLLSLSHIEQETERDQIHLKYQEIEPAIRASIQTCQIAASKKPVTLKLDCDRALKARINAGRLEQAITNLIDNAIKYSHANSSIEISGFKKHDAVLISVRDQGAGIPPEHLPRIFERFYRADRARSREHGGTGLGLAIVKHVALAHGGQVTVDSTVGKGSVFTIHLPATG
jgi:two-component system phosphate regulon sensor histidine kinase PhoR